LRAHCAARNATPNRKVVVVNRDDEIIARLIFVTKNVDPAGRFIVWPSCRLLGQRVAPHRYNLFVMAQSYSFCPHRFSRLLGWLLGKAFQ
jgi:hypothetical protein